LRVGQKELAEQRKKKRPPCKNGLVAKRSDTEMSWRIGLREGSKIAMSTTCAELVFLT